MQFLDLHTQYLRYKSEIHQSMQRVLDSACFVDGPVVQELEYELAQYTGAPHAIACSSGTDALYAVLIALDLQPGDEVIVPDFTFFATAEVIVRLGAIPIFADVDPLTWTIDPQDILRKISARTKGIIPVSLFGQCADMETIQSIADIHNLWVFEDGAQSFGATRNGKKSCNISPFACTSFFPSKPLGAFGNGGAIFCRDPELAHRIRILLSHGQESRYQHSFLGINGRMDALQAAVLLVKLRYLDTELQSRNQFAEYLLSHLQNDFTLPYIGTGNRSTWAQFTLMHPQRDKICQQLSHRGIPTAIHYPRPLHSQPAFQFLASSCVENPVTEKLSQQVFSIPLHAFLSTESLEKICEALDNSISE